MHLKISDVIQLLKIVNSFLDDNKKANQNQVLKQIRFQKIHRGTSFPNYIDSKQFCLDAKILKETRDFLYFTPLGNDVFEHIDSSKFNKIIIEKCIFNNYFSDIIIPILTKFHKTKENELWYEVNEISRLFIGTNILEILYGLEFLQQPDPKKIIVNPQFLNDELIEDSIKNTRKQSQADIEEALVILKKRGQIAEKFVLKYEKDRLKKRFPDKANRVKQISDDWANKGYDIESFNGEGDDILPDRFIEVKGSSGKKFNIFWSQNEIKKAKEFGDEYWIYFVSEINVDTEKCPNYPEMIQNPFERIKPYENNLDDEFLKKFESLHITKND